MNYCTVHCCMSYFPIKLKIIFFPVQADEVDDAEEDVSLHAAEFDVSAESDELLENRGSRMPHADELEDEEEELIALVAVDAVPADQLVSKNNFKKIVFLQLHATFSIVCPTTCETFHFFSNSGFRRRRL